MRLQHIIEQIHRRPWFISPEGHASVAALVRSKLADQHVKGEMDFSDLINVRPKFSMDVNKIAHIWVFGVLGQGLSPIEKSCGNTDYADVRADIQAAKNSGARGVFLHVDSPGGMCSGCVEASRELAAIEIPKIAFTDSLMASAAYSLASGCGEIIATDSAMVGCIGTILPWVDSSAAWTAEGLNFQPITNDGADLKSSMHGPELTPAQVEYLTELANDYAAQFIGQVQTHRMPSDEVYRGGCYVGTRAFQYGLIDEIGSYDYAYSRLISKLR